MQVGLNLSVHVYDEAICHDNILIHCKNPTALPDMSRKAVRLLSLVAPNADTAMLEADLPLIIQIAW